MIVARVPGHNLLRVVGRAAQAAFAEPGPPVSRGGRMMEWFLRCVEGPCRAVMDELAVPVLSC